MALSVPMHESQYNGRVVIILNRTGRKYGSAKYTELPESAVTVATDLKTFLEGLNMLVCFEQNVDKQRFEDLAQKLIRPIPKYGDHEVILFFFIGHGEKGELLPACNCKSSGPSAKHCPPQKIVDFIKLFHNDDTEHLRKIPMLFFFDCCQGDGHDEGIQISMGLPEIQVEEIEKYIDRIPSVGNILVAHSTLPMKKSYCDPNHGPNWTRVLLQQLQINQSISDALHATQRKVSMHICGTSDIPKLQSSMFYSTLHCGTINFHAMRASVSPKEFSDDLSPTDVVSWLSQQFQAKSLPFNTSLRQKLIKNDINGEALLELTSKDLIDMEFTKGQRIKTMNIIKSVKGENKEVVLASPSQQNQASMPEKKADSSGTTGDSDSKEECSDTGYESPQYATKKKQGSGSLIYKCHGHDCTGKCTIHDYFHQRHCVRSEELQYLHVEGRSYESCLLDTELAKATRNIQFAFASVREHTFTQLSINCPINNVRQHFKRLVGIEDCHIRTYEELEDELFRSYCSWFNFDILKEIRKKFLFPDGTVDKILQTYEHKFFSFCRRRCFESPRSFLPEPNSTIMKSLVFKIDENFDNYTLKQVHVMRATVIDVIKCPKYAVYIRSVEEGCVEVSCSILSEAVVNYLNWNQISQLRESGIFSFKIEDKELMDVSDDHDVLDSTIDSEDYNASNEEEEDDFISDDSKEGSSFTATPSGSVAMATGDDSLEGDGHIEDDNWLGGKKQANKRDEVNANSGPASNGGCIEDDFNWFEGGKKEEHRRAQKRGQYKAKLRLHKDDNQITEIIPEKSVHQPYSHRGFYSMKAEKHGVALIINNKTFLAKEHKVRMETDRDEQNLIETWLFLGYYIVVVRNITRDEMARTFEKIDTLLNIAEGVANDSFVCCILSHGRMGEVYGTDSQPLKHTWIQKYLAKSEILHSRPKLLFIQACQHSNSGSDALADRLNEIDSDDDRISEYTDFYLSCASVYGSHSYRDSNTGTWFISELCQTLCERSMVMDLDEIQKEVNENVVRKYTFLGKKQHPCGIDQLRKKVFFFHE